MCLRTWAPLNCSDFSPCYCLPAAVFDVFAHLGACDEQLDFPVLYASAREVITISTMVPTAAVQPLRMLLLICFVQQVH